MTPFRFFIAHTADSRWLHRRCFETRHYSAPRRCGMVCLALEGTLSRCMEPIHDTISQLDTTIKRCLSASKYATRSSSGESPQEGG